MHYIQICKLLNSKQLRFENLRKLYQILWAPREMI